ncbi:MAG: thiazole synthase, partial [Planctomycetes bacterium]|nr:thiazole synthase [Planctomycetota bacterium]
MATDVRLDDVLQLGGHSLDSRLIVGSGKYDDFELMRESLEASGARCITVAVRRERLYNPDGKNILDFLDLDRYVLLPNTAGCF